jgi:protein involved in temperature-dependent protein secretion
LQPERTAWRYQLALLLQANGNLLAAREQASLCANLEPANERYVQLQKKLIRSVNTVQ